MQLVGHELLVVGHLMLKLVNVSLKCKDIVQQNQFRNHEKSSQTWCAYTCKYSR